MIYDLLALAGTILLCIGIWAQFGWPFAAIMAGIILLAAGIKGALNDSTEDIKQTED